MKKILYVATVVKTHIMEFHIPYLQMLKEERWHTEVAAKNDYDNPSDCVIPYCDEYYDVPFGRNPFKPSNLKAYKELKKIINEGKQTPSQVNTIAIGKSFRFLAENGDIYECSMKKVGNVKNKKSVNC